ncbi:hypothetical protein MJN85_31460, partial [Salmonella enterica subsp. enterica serovar Anatum]|nr:hypothetical protein [Salmonella enterica subsp. enterica serovar Anatum]
QALTWQQFKPHERAGVSSVVMMVALLAPACSPAIGGLLVETCILIQLATPLYLFSLFIGINKHDVMRINEVNGQEPGLVLVIQG